MLFGFVLSLQIRLISTGHVSPWGYATSGTVTWLSSACRSQLYFPFTSMVTQVISDVSLHAHLYRFSQLLRLAATVSRDTRMGRSAVARCVANVVEKDVAPLSGPTVALIAVLHPSWIREYSAAKRRVSLKNIPRRRLKSPALLPLTVRREIINNRCFSPVKFSKRFTTLVTPSNPRACYIWGYL